MNEPDQSKPWHVYRAEGYYPDNTPFPNYSVYPTEDVQQPMWWKRVIASFDLYMDALNYCHATEAAQRIHDD